MKSLLFYFLSRNPTLRWNAWVGGFQILHLGCRNMWFRVADNGVTEYCIDHEVYNTNLNAPDFMGAADRWLESLKV